MDLKDFSRVLKQVKELTSDELLELSKKARAGDSIARRRLIEGNMPLVITVAARSFHKAKHLGQDDLIQQGFLGLIEAVDRYDPYKINPQNNQPYRFSTYAVFWIEHYIQHALQYIEDEIHVPFERMKETAFDNPVSHSLDQLNTEERSEIEEIAARDLVGERVHELDRIKFILKDVEWTGLEREVFKLSSGIVDGISRSEREIAAILGLEIKAIKNILKRAREKAQAGIENATHT